MSQSLFPESEPSFVLYVEDAYNTEINSFIQANYKQIVEYYSAKDIDFCYLPYLLQDDNYQAVLNYNRPYLLNRIEDSSIAEIYRNIKSKLNEPLEGAGLVWVNGKSGDVGFSLQNKGLLLDTFELIATTVEKSVFEHIVCIAYENNALYTTSYSIESEPCAIDNEINADADFDDQAYRLAFEIRERIKLLKETGSLKLIGDILEEIQRESKKLSTLFITNDYRIFLQDYGMKEVVMPPLPKSVFILFLRHPEGIVFKQLSNYHDELLSIYRNITVHENIDRVMDSIRAMTDPLNNSINEKCSRIRAAFLEVIVDDLAQNYYVTGRRGQPKKIIIDRSMLKFQK